MSSDPQAAIDPQGVIREARKACHCLYIAVAEDVADHVKARVEALIALLEQVQRETMWQGSDNGEDWVDVGPDEADAECYGYKRKIFLPQPPTGDAP